MPDKTLIRRTPRHNENREWDSSGTWGNAGARELPVSSGSVEYNQPDSLLRFTPSRASVLFSGDPTPTEPSKIGMYGVASGIDPTLDAVRASLVDAASRLEGLRVGVCSSSFSPSGYEIAEHAHGIVVINYGRLPAMQCRDVREVLSQQPVGGAVFESGVFYVEREAASVAEEARFNALCARWRRETINVSSTPGMAMHPAYQQIIGMGSVALPLILRELRERPDWWFWALQALTGADPVPAEDSGVLRSMTLAWVNWGREYGFITG